MEELDENNIACMYGNKQMSVAEYKQKRGVAEFERKLKVLAMTSAYVRADKSDIRTDKLYSLFKPGYPTQQNRRCPHFETVMLKTDKKLEADYWAVFEGGKVNNGETKDNCKNCLQEYVKASNRQKYCERCRDIGEQARKRAYYNNHKE